jgi:hypothetical protein
MKNKIILLLVLLIPSLCFALYDMEQSLRITTSIDDEKNLYTVEILNSLNRSPQIYTFKLENDFIIVEENEEYYTFLGHLMSMMPTPETGDFCERKKIIRCGWIAPEIEKFAIINKYILTFKEYHKRDDRINVVMYFYKPKK